MAGPDEGDDLPLSRSRAREQLELPLLPLPLAESRGEALSVATEVSATGALLGCRPLVGRRPARTAVSVRSARIDQERADGAAAMPNRNGLAVPSNCWPIKKPIAAAPNVPTTPWTDEAVPAIGPICSIASVPRLDEVKAKLAIVSPCKTTKTVKVSCPLGAIAAWTAVSSANAALRYARPGAGRSVRRSAS